MAVGMASIYYYTDGTKFWRGSRCSGEQDEGDASVPTAHHPNPRFQGSAFWGQIVTFVGAGVVWTWGGDACVALVLLLCTLSPSSQGDASVPTPHNPSPAPTGTKGLPKRHGKIPTRVRLSSENLSGKQSFRREKRSQEPSRALISSGSSSPSEAFLPCSVRS